ncbi:hypothetical protein TERTU_2906 [Teredinibacter turnerae T7901]|uniref:Uncharacterized protein n=1 Tax=Teredinibacter turnerae (strain ATCC 39867 / T7901) TaxID=377629 RepID=C5BNB9_TERTT|nr:hypothetical protein TERTU_2906 [Teredinibacter turnerae T7901]
MPFYRTLPYRTLPYRTALPALQTIDTLTGFPVAPANLEISNLDLSNIVDMSFPCNIRG